MSTQQLLRVSMMSAILAVLTQISIPLGPVPFTLQTLAVILCGIILGPKNGFLSVLLYLVLGAIGLPVFSGLTGGFDKLLGPTGGYLISFLFTALLSGFTAAKTSSVSALYASGIICFIITHFFGLAYFSFVTSTDLSSSLPLVFYPFIIPDLIKMIIAVNIGSRIRKRLYQK